MNNLEALCEEIARAFDAPIAWIGFLSDHGEEIAGAWGSKANHVSLEKSLATRIADEREPVVVTDVSRDPRFSGHPLVTASPGIRFYAAAPILDSEAHFLGAISVADRTARNATPAQLAVLRLAARSVMAEIASRELLLESSERFREFFEQSGDFVVSIAPGGRLLHANETALTTLGIACGASLLDAAAPDHADDLRAAIDSVFETGSLTRIETVFINTNGDQITLEGTLRPKISGAQPVLARAILRDVTDRKHFESQLSSARDAALEAARVKTQFLSNVSHEIRTPMNGITGMIDLLLSTQLDAEQQDYLHQARSGAEQLLSIVHNILYISNVEGASLDAALVDFDLHRTMQRIVDVISVEALGKDIEVSFVSDPALPLVCRGNRSKLQRIVTNLLENAVKFTSHGSVSLHVALERETDTHHVIRFEVRDTGIGIADEDRLLLFERFMQLDAGATRRFAGAGLGLATARHLVETLGGIMDVESAPGKGSTFWLTIPFPKVRDGLRPVTTSDLDLKGMRVLVLDALPTSRRLLTHYLESAWQMRVDVAEGLPTAMQMLREATGDPYRIFFFDRLQDPDPLPLLEQLREDPTITLPGLVLLTNIGSPLDIDAMRAAGIRAHVSKPLGQHELFEAISVAVSHDAISFARPVMTAEATPPPLALTDVDRGSIRILLAEDNFLNMKLTMSQLQKLGFRADSVANGKELLDVLTQKNYNVVLMDCQMPIMDGYAATIEIRRRESLIGARHYIIAMTANALEGDRERCLAAGMDDYLAKPTRLDDLERAILTWAGRIETGS
ncbi:MAG TPA: response regulator [Thermoanaerobaculia bacterium]